MYYSLFNGFYVLNALFYIIESNFIYIEGFNNGKFTYNINVNNSQYEIEKLNHNISIILSNYFNFEEKYNNVLNTLDYSSFKRDNYIEYVFDEVLNTYTAFTHIKYYYIQEHKDIIDSDNYKHTIKYYDKMITITKFMTQIIYKKLKEYQEYIKYLEKE